MDHVSTRSYRPSLFLASFLGLVFLALSSVRILGDAGSAALGGPVISAALGDSIFDTRLGVNLLTFAATLALLHIVFGLTCWLLALLSQRAWPRSTQSGNTWLWLWFAISVCWVLVANAALFPHSSLGSVHYLIAQARWLGISVFEAMSAALSVAVLWLLFSACRRWNAFTWVGAGRASTLVVAAICLWLIPFGRLLHADAGQHTRPHVILIGIDSLRPDAVGTGEKRTPALDDFLQSAVRFNDTTTPLARTFPSWTALITGKNPHTTGALINLLPRDLVQTGDTLPSLLSGAGYTSVYATDEVRFSNLDQSYGFTRLITPPMGATDFLIGFFGDTPLSNLLVNTRLGALLLPYLSGNRAAAHVYDPDTFIERLDREMEFHQPTFLAVHLTLPHWPYSWADAPTGLEGTGEWTLRRSYQVAVERVDRQFGQLMQVLHKNGALDNAIVILMSDHGESLGSSADLPEPHDNSLGVTIDEAHLVGHGTSVFSSHQYQVLLAMRSYGNPLIPDSIPTITAAVSLEDVTPTVLDLLSIGANTPFDGHSLFPLLASDHEHSGAFAKRIRFTETEFNPKGFSPDIVISASAMKKAAAYYRVDPESDRVLVRKELLARVVEQRQFAALLGDQVLAAVPIQTDHGLSRRFILVQSGQRPRVIDAQALNEGEQVRQLRGALIARYPSLASLPDAPALEAPGDEEGANVPTTNASDRD